MDAQILSGMKTLIRIGPDAACALSSVDPIVVHAHASFVYGFMMLPCLILGSRSSPRDHQFKDIRDTLF